MAGETKDLILNGRKARGVADATQLAAPATKEQQTTPVAAPQKAEVPKTFGGVMNDKGEMVGQMTAPQLKTPEINSDQLKKWQALNAPDPNESEGEKTLRDYMNSINAPSAKEEEAERKKARNRAIIGGVSDMAVAVANIINANKGGVAMPQSNLAGMYSGKWQERKKEIDALRDKKANVVLKLSELKDKRKANELAAKQAQQKLGIDMAKLQIEIEKAKQDGDIKKAQALKAEMEAAKAQTEALIAQLYGGKEKESIIKRNNASAASSYASANKTNKEANKMDNEQYTEIPMGNGTMVKIEAHKLNDATVGYLFNQLPPEVRKEYGQTITTDLAKNMTVTKNPSKTQMLNAIGANVAESEALRRELNRLAGDKHVPAPNNKMEKPKDKDYFQQYQKTGATGAKDYSMYKLKK